MANRALTETRVLGDLLEAKVLFKCALREDSLQLLLFGSGFATVEAEQRAAEVIDPSFIYASRKITLSALSAHRVLVLAGHACKMKGSPTEVSKQTTQRNVEVARTRLLRFVALRKVVTLRTTVCVLSSMARGAWERELSGEAMGAEFACRRTGPSWLSNASDSSLCRP
eukprot:CAMPEP_0117549252 /NCGR_PEP_ID=MMETSP0784-20121206/48069_1 /TAXON_ID=39447 /ORGANISM="" /LENGTH=168 /DNA_ID=CAMNT_0005346233 /DNA_START=616 /DNA_END=1123 /DNA_ORIENTATION=-